MNKRTAIALLTTILCMATALNAHSASLDVTTDYRLRSITYTNNDYDNTTSTDTPRFYSQDLRIGIQGNFVPGVEIGVKISAVGVAGSTTAYAFAYPGVIGSSHTITPPYPRTDFTPFIENAYIKLTNIGDYPIDLIFGKQPLTYGNGLIICDNGMGMNALRLIARPEIGIPFTRLRVPLTFDIFTAKTRDNFNPDTDHDLYGAVTGFSVKDNQCALGYFEERDFTGTKYYQGTNEFDTRGIVKQYVDFRIGNTRKISSFNFEIAQQGGYVTQPNGSQITLGGMGYVLGGELIGEKTKLGKVRTRAEIAVCSGDSDPLSFNDDNSFAPTYTRRWDGLEPVGYGKMFAASPGFSAVPIPAAYSGIDTLSLGVAFTPVYAWTFGVDYYLYSASHGVPGAPEASGFERLYGAEFTLGVEMDLSVKFLHSKYVEGGFIYSRYTPPKFDVYWPKSEPATRYELEISAKF